MKRICDCGLAFAVMLAVGSVIAVKVFSNGDLNPLGLSFVTGWIAGILLVTVLLHPQLSRWLTPVVLASLFAGFFFPEKLGKAVTAIDWVAIRVQPLGMAAGASIIVGAFVLFSLFFWMGKPKRKDPTASSEE